MNESKAKIGENDSSLDIEEIRAQFPILDQEVNGKPLVYLDSAASAQKPLCVLEAIDHYYRSDHSNVHRGAHTLGDRATQAFENSREVLREFLNARSRSEIIWTKGTTEAINLVANGLASSLKEGDEIIVSRMEHHANIVPWQLVSERTGAKLKIFEIEQNGELLIDEFEELITSRSKVLAIAHVSNALGTINPIKNLIAVAKQHDIITVIDGAQAAPHISIDVQNLDCDFYALSSHKLFGPTGIGVLYGKEARLEALPPYQGGGEMIERVSFEKTTFNALPYKFEAGTPAISEAIGFAAAINFFSRFDRNAIEAHEQSLLLHANSSVEEIPGMKIIGNATHKVSLLSFTIEGLHPSDIGTLLDQQGIGIRTGHHCAMPLMDFYGIPGTARASFAFYNTIDEVDRLFTGLAKIQGMFA